MRLADLITGGQVNQSDAQVAQSAAVRGGVRPDQGSRQLQSLTPGQTLQGEVVSRNGSEVQIRLSDDVIVNARVDQNMNLEIGKNMTFEVRSNGHSLTLSPLFANMASDVNVLRALDMASLPVNQNTVSMTGLMMQAGLPVDRNALTQMFREVNAFPGAEVADIVDLHKLGIRVNEDHLAQISSYKNLTHQLVDGMHAILDSLPETMRLMAQDGNTEEAAGMFRELLQMIQNLPGEEIPGTAMEVNDGQLPIQPDADPQAQAVQDQQVQTPQDDVRPIPAGADVPARLDVIAQTGTPGQTEGVSQTGQAGQAEGAGQAVQTETAAQTQGAHQADGSTEAPASVVQPEQTGTQPGAGEMPAIPAGLWDVGLSGLRAKEGEAQTALETPQTERQAAEPSGILTEHSVERASEHPAIPAEKSGELRELLSALDRAKEPEETQSKTDQAQRLVVKEDIKNMPDAAAGRVGQTEPSAAEARETEHFPLTRELMQLADARGRLPEYSGLLRDLALAEAKGDPAEQAKLLQQIFQQGIREHDQPLLKSMVESRNAQKLLTDGLSRLWTIEPREVADSGKVEELYQRLGRQLKTLTHMLEQGGATESGSYKAVANMTQNLDFLQQLNQAYTYVQLPLRLQQGDAHGDLYVYTNKRNLAAKDGQISALLHLDMEHLGPVDVYVAMQAERVNTRFYVKDDEMLDFLEQHMDILTERLQKRGYRCSFDMQVREGGSKPESGLNGLLAQEQGTAQPLGQYAFDMRA